MSEEISSQFIPNVHFELIPIKNLVSNQPYQRPISGIHVGRTAAHFDLYQINPVKVSRRDGINYVFDGQHTIETVAICLHPKRLPKVVVLCAKSFSPEQKISQWRLSRIAKQSKLPPVSVLRKTTGMTGVGHACCRSFFACVVVAFLPYKSVKISTPFLRHWRMDPQ